MKISISLPKILGYEEYTNKIDRLLNAPLSNDLDLKNQRAYQNLQDLVLLISDFACKLYLDKKLDEAESIFVQLLDNGFYTQPCFDRLIHIYLEKNSKNGLRDLLKYKQLNIFNFQGKNYIRERIEKILDDADSKVIKENIKQLIKEKKLKEAETAFDENAERIGAKYPDEKFNLLIEKAKYLIKNKKYNESWKLLNELILFSSKRNEFRELSIISSIQSEQLLKEKKYKDSLLQLIASDVYTCYAYFLQRYKATERCEMRPIDFNSKKYLTTIEKGNLSNYVTELNKIVSEEFKQFSVRSINIFEKIRMVLAR